MPPRSPTYQAPAELGNALTNSANAGVSPTVAALGQWLSNVTAITSCPPAHGSSDVPNRPTSSVNDTACRVVEPHAAHSIPRLTKNAPYARHSATSSSTASGDSARATKPRPQ